MLTKATLPAGRRLVISLSFSEGFLASQASRIRAFACAGQAAAVRMNGDERSAASGYQEINGPNNVPA